MRKHLRRRVAKQIARSLASQDEVLFTRKQLWPFSTTQGADYDATMRKNLETRIGFHLGSAVAVTWRRYSPMKDADTDFESGMVVEASASRANEHTLMEEADVPIPEFNTP